MLWPGRTAESPRAAAAGPVVPGSAGSAPCCTVRSWLRTGARWRTPADARAQELPHARACCAFADGVTGRRPSVGDQVEL